MKWTKQTFNHRTKVHSYENVIYECELDNIKIEKWIDGCNYTTYRIYTNCKRYNLDGYVCEFHYLKDAKAEAERIAEEN